MGTATPVQSQRHKDDSGVDAGDDIGGDDDDDDDGDDAEGASPSSWTWSSSAEMGGREETGATNTFGLSLGFVSRFLRQRPAAELRRLATDSFSERRHQIAKATAEALPIVDPFRRAERMHQLQAVIAQDLPRSLSTSTAGTTAAVGRAMPPLARFLVAVSLSISPILLRAHDSLSFMLSPSSLLPRRCASERQGTSDPAAVRCRINIVLVICSSSL
eukprot:GHVU01066582.1.p1 GENE.GHVU01066582.1~~GHVU01066582.1.p1  ORF type:complete len:234 (-),score=29.59 GHVU01066582.1:1703-2353(-)